MRKSLLALALIGSISFYSCDDDEPESFSFCGPVKKTCNGDIESCTDENDNVYYTYQGTQYNCEDGNCASALQEAYAAASEACPDFDPAAE